MKTCQNCNFDKIHEAFMIPNYLIRLKQIKEIKIKIAGACILGYVRWKDPFTLKTKTPEIYTKVSCPYWQRKNGGK